MDSSAHYTMMQTAPPDSPLRQLFLERVLGNPEALVANPKEAADLLWSSHDPNLAYFGESFVFAGDTRVKSLLNLPGRVDVQLAFALRKDSELTPVFNRVLREMDQAGVLRKIELEWW